MKIVKYLTAMSLVVALASCGAEETPSTEPTSNDTTATAETTPETTPEPAAAVSAVGTWGLEGFEMPGMDEMMAGMAESNPEQFAAAKAQMDEMLVKMKESGALVVNEDGSCTMTMINMGTGENESKDGTWTMSEDNKTFTMDMDGKVQAMEVTELTENSFGMSITEEDMTVNMTWVR